MTNPVKIAVDAMGGENSPTKVIKGIQDHHKKSKNIYYRIFGNKQEILKFIPKDLDSNFLEVLMLL